MNHYILSVIIVSVLFIPVSFASAQTITFHSSEEDDGIIVMSEEVEIQNLNLQDSMRVDIHWARLLLLVGWIGLCYMKIIQFLYKRIMFSLCT